MNRKKSRQIKAQGRALLNKNKTESKDRNKRIIDPMKIIKTIKKTKLKERPILMSNSTKDKVEIKIEISNMINQLAFTEMHNKM